jgi:hypothetical protein
MSFGLQFGKLYLTIDGGQPGLDGSFGGITLVREKGFRKECIFPPTAATGKIKIE